MSSFWNFSDFACDWIWGSNWLFSFLSQEMCVPLFFFFELTTLITSPFFLVWVERLVILRKNQFHRSQVLFHLPRWVMFVTVSTAIVLTKQFTQVGVQKCFSSCVHLSQSCIYTGSLLIFPTLNDRKVEDEL